MTELDQLIAEQQRDMTYGNRIESEPFVALSLDKPYDGGTVGTMLDQDGRLPPRPRGSRMEGYLTGCVLHTRARMSLRADGTTRCKECARIAAAAWRKRNPEKARAASAAYHMRHKVERNRKRNEKKRQERAERG